VRDASHPDTEAQRADVVAVLEALGVGSEDERPVIEALNKIDQLNEDDRMVLLASARMSAENAAPTIAAPIRVGVSALSGEGVGDLETLIDAVLTAGRETLGVDVPTEDGAAQAWLHAHTDVLSRDEFEGAIRFTARFTEKTRGQFVKFFPQARLVEKAAPRDLMRRPA
jgi:GTP-binding protein HflX